MANSIAQKLKIKDGFALRTINAPADFKKRLAPLPDGVSISPSTKKYQQIHWFVLNKAQLDKELPAMIDLVKEDAGVIILKAHLNCRPTLPAIRAGISSCNTSSSTG